VLGDDAFEAKPSAVKYSVGQTLRHKTEGWL
jgi:hypothetical protein